MAYYLSNVDQLGVRLLDITPNDGCLMMDACLIPVVWLLRAAPFFFHSWSLVHAITIANFLDGHYWYLVYPDLVKSKEIRV